MNQQDLKINDLDISIRCHQALKNIGVVYLNQLSNYTPEELSSSRFSKKSIEEISLQMKANNIGWRS